MATVREGYVSFIHVDIRREDEGLLVATSPTLPGMLVIAKNEDELREDIPVSIRALWKAQHGVDVEVLPASVDRQDDADEPFASWAAVPAAVAAQKLSACP